MTIVHTPSHHPAHAECHALTLRSFRYVDMGMASAVIECFTDTAVLDRYGDITVGAADLRRTFDARQQDTSRATCHAVVNYAAIDVDPDSCVEAHYAMLVYQAQSADAPNEFVGVRFCEDRYVRVGERWLISYRRQVRLGAHLPTQDELRGRT